MATINIFWISNSDMASIIDKKLHQKKSYEAIWRKIYKFDFIKKNGVPTLIISTYYTIFTDKNYLKIN